MDKKEFLKALSIVGLLNTLVVVVLVIITFLLYKFITVAPLFFAFIILCFVIGYASAFVYLKLKEKK